MTPSKKNSKTTSKAHSASPKGAKKTRSRGKGARQLEGSGGPAAPPRSGPGASRRPRAPGARGRILTVVAEADGRLRVDPRHELLVFDGRELRPPTPSELCPVPRGSDLFMLPGRQALGRDPGSGETRPLAKTSGEPRLAASAFLAPAWLRLTHPASLELPGAPTLPTFAYAPLGFDGQNYVTTALRVDPEPRQDPWRFDLERIRRRVDGALSRLPRNRLVRHLSRCALSYSCRAAQNYFLGRFEAPLPTARTCNAACLGCISAEQEGGTTASHDRIAFVPTAAEVAEVALTHARRVKRAVVSFGQGCEGEPLSNPALLLESIERIRREDKDVCINLNSNASRPEVVAELFSAGLSSLRVSLNSLREPLYDAYFRPRNYGFVDVLRSIELAEEASGFVSLNYFVFPGVTDQRAELEALEALLDRRAVTMIQWRNLNVDPANYLRLMAEAEGPGSSEIERPLGLLALLKRLRTRYPALGHGYFNPYVPPTVRGRGSAGAG